LNPPPPPHQCPYIMSDGAFLQQLIQAKMIFPLCPYLDRWKKPPHSFLVYLVRFEQVGLRRRINKAITAVFFYTVLYSILHMKKRGCISMEQE
jgi:hypothetical protein